MARPLAHFLRLLTLGIVLFAAACTKTVYVRAPGICPQDTECLAFGQPNVSAAAARAREEGFIRRTVASTVTVRGLRYNGEAGRSALTGSGTIIGSKGYVLTAYHVIQGAQLITVTLRSPAENGRYQETREALATPLVTSRDADLALLMLNVSGSMPPPMAIRHDKVILGDRVWFLGDHGPLVNGTIAQADVAGDGDVSLAEAEIPSRPLDNGSPVLNACGEIVGVALGPYGKNGRLRLVPIEHALAALGVTRADLR